MAGRRKACEITPEACEMARVNERGDNFERDRVEAEFAQRRQHVGGRSCGEFQRVGNVPSGRPVMVKLLHVVEHTKKVRPMRITLLMLQVVEHGDAEGSHAGEEGGYLLADLGHQGHPKTRR